MKTGRYSPNDFQAFANPPENTLHSEVQRTFVENQRFIDNLFEHAYSYFFISCYSRMEFVFMSRSVRNVLGFTNDFFYDHGYSAHLDSVSEEDRANLKLIHQKMFQYFYSYPVQSRKDLKFALNYRVNRKDKTQIMLLQETHFIDICPAGHPIFDFSMCTDITSHTKETSLKLIVYKKNNGAYDKVSEFEVNQQNNLLTHRQIEILNLLSKGLTTAQIAARLFLSEETVKIHRKNILTRTGAKNSIEAVNMILNG